MSSTRSNRRLQKCLVPILLLASSRFAYPNTSTTAAAATNTNVGILPDVIVSQFDDSTLHALSEAGIADHRGLATSGENAASYAFAEASAGVLKTYASSIAVSSYLHDGRTSGMAFASGRFDDVIDIFSEGHYGETADVAFSIYIPYNVHITVKDYAKSNQAGKPEGFSGINYQASYGTTSISRTAEEFYGEGKTTFSFETSLQHDGVTTFDELPFGIEVLTLHTHVTLGTYESVQGQLYSFNTAGASRNVDIFGTSASTYLTASADASHSFYWGGISSVTIGNEAIDYDVISGSGIDWRNSFIPTSVPEPQSGLMWFAGLLMAASIKRLCSNHFSGGRWRPACHR